MTGPRESPPQPGGEASVDAAPGAGLSDALGVIAARARGRNLQRVERIEALLALGSVGPSAPRAPGPLDDATLAAATELAHLVAGSAGTFGDDDASRVARELESRLGSRAAFDQVAEAVAALRSALE